MPTNLKATVYSDALLGSGCGCLNFTTQLPYNPKIGRWEASVDTCGGVTVRVAWDDQAGSYFLTYSCDGFQQAVAQQTCNPFFAAALFSAGSCCPKPGKAADVYVSGPEMPLECSRPCTCPCDCTSGGSPPPSTQPNFDPAPPRSKPRPPKEHSAAPIRYSTGEIVLSASDLASGGFGTPWGHTRSFANRQADNFDGGQGYNWRVAQWPYLTALGNGPLVAMFDANNSIWFDAIDGGYAARHGETVSLVYDAAADVFRLTDNLGNATEFNGSTLAFSAHIDAAGNRTEVVSYLNDAAMNPTEVRRSFTDASGTATIESYLYGYQSSIDGIWRLIAALLRRSTDGGATWTNIRQAVYAYWTDDDAYGALGDLKTATVQTWQDGAWADLTTTLYRYYKAPPFTPDCDCGSSSSSSSSTPSDPAYLAHLVKYVVEPDSYARLAADPNVSGDPADAPDWLAALYADNYFEYDNQRRVTLESVEGASRTYTYAYSTSTFAPHGDYNTWVTKTVEALPGGAQNVTYANYIGQVMLSVKTPGTGQAGNGPWYEYFRYDQNANQVVRAESSAITGYDEAAPDLLNCQTISSFSSASSSDLCSCPAIAPGNLEYLSDHSGLVHLFDYDAASGQLTGERIRNGEFGCDNKLWERVYTPFAVTASSSSSSSSSSGSRETSSGPVYLLTQEVQFPDDITVDPNQSRQIITGYAYTFFPGTLQVRTRTTTWPVVSTEQNGSGVAGSRVEVFDSYGNLTWTLDERGFIHYQGHDVATGAVIQTITDFDTNLTGQPTPPAGWTTPVGGGLNLVTDTTVDSLGRTTQTLGPWHEIDISGVATAIRRATWTVYQDADFQIWTGQGLATYSPLPPGEGWGEGGSSLSTSSSSSSTSGAYNFVLVNPVSITMFDEIGRVTDQISAIRSTLPLPPGEGWGEGVLSAGALSSTDSFLQSSYCRWTTNQYTDCCKLASTRVYYAVPSSGSGEEGVNFNETIFGYDFLNRQNRVVSPGGTITRTVFDARDLPISVWVGTNDTGATWADPTGGDATGNNMVQVTENGYDNGVAGGDANLTKITEYVDSATSRVIIVGFDWRNRRVQITAAQDWYQITTRDNMSRETQLDEYAQLGGNLIRRSETLFDDRGRVYQVIRYAVDLSTGNVGNSLTDNNWYDAARNAIKELPAGSSAFTKSVFDGVGRQIAEYVGYDLGGEEASYASASDVSDDIIVEQTETSYDAASNVIQTTLRQRYHNATGTGALTSPGGVQPVARVVYVASYPDAIGREQASANYGTNGNAALSRPAAIPARADIVLVTTTVYNPRGEAYQTINPAGRLDQTTFDDAGRRTALVLNVQVEASSSSCSSSSGGLPIAGDQSNTTLWSYTAGSEVGSLTAINSATGSQTTIYLYGSTMPTSDVARNDVLASIIYPGGGIAAYLVNRQSQVKQFTDQRGVTHEYGFDLLGREIQDAVISLGPSSSSSSSSSGTQSPKVDDTVLRINRAYEVRGFVRNITSYSSPLVGQGAVVNDVQRGYNGFGQVVAEYQEHAGAVNPSISVSVQYAYADGSANTKRPIAIVYPNGRQVNLSYGASGGIDDALSRIAGLIDDDGVTHLADYTRIGRDTIVEQSSPEPQTAWTLINGTGLDPYTGLDQFSRVIDSRWYSTATNSDFDRIQHGYDRADKRLWRKNTVAAAAGVYLDELYGYDGLDRLGEMQRGQLNSSSTALVPGTLNFAQAWGLDATGNWQQFWQSDTGSSWDLRQSRAANSDNEITSMMGGVWAPPRYDAAGSLVGFPQASVPVVASEATYDAWNRPCVLSAAGSLVQQNVYDGLMRRICKLSSGSLRHYYLSPGWRPLEERQDSASSADRQFVWGIRHVSDLLLRDRGDERCYVMQDPNWNVSAIADSMGTILERYVYSSYGTSSVLDESFSPLSQSLYSWEVRFAGYYMDVESLLLLAQRRFLHSRLGCWLSVDPLGYLGGDVNLRGYVLNDPINRTDPTGTLSGLEEYLACEAAVRAPAGGVCGCAAPAALWIGVFVGLDVACELRCQIRCNNEGLTACEVKAHRSSRKCASLSVEKGHIELDTLADYDACVWKNLLAFKQQCFNAATACLASSPICNFNQPSFRCVKCKKPKWRCTSKPRGHCSSNCQTPFEGYGDSRSEAKEAAEQACYSAGCHTPGESPFNCDCGHATCRRRPN